MHLKAKIKSLPQEPGIYQFYDEKDKLLYVGKSISIKKRVSSYFSNKNPGTKTQLLIKKTKDIKYIKVFSEFEALLLESELIKKYQPFFNIVAKDDKTPLYIKITSGEVPLITTTRKEKPQKGVFLKGPFPSAKTTRQALKIIRKIFPYCHHKNPKKPCFFVHLNLCPYPYQSEEAKKEYRRTVSKIKKLLSGRSKQLIRQLTREMDNFSKKLEFEKAQGIKNQIEKIQYLTTTYHSPAEFLEKSSLVDDLTLSKLKNLTSFLELKKIPRRIECYDISNISGKFAAGSMVVFANGQGDKAKYRRFKIKFSEKPNDYQMLEEVLTRRFKNNWPKPDLIIVDGGRGHLNITLNILQNLNLSIPAISLAKRFDEIYIPSKILPIALSCENSAKQLIQSIRDEAHRFALAYHKLLRSKEQIK